MKLTDLPLDCLLCVFSYCNETDLLNVCYSSTFLEAVIEDNIFRLQTLDLLMCGLRHQPRIMERTLTPLKNSNRLTIARNWLKGRYLEREYFHHRQMFAAKLVLERDWFYISYGSYLRQYRRLNTEPLQRRYEVEISTNIKSDISDFTKKRDTIFAGRICGSCYIYESGYSTEQRLHTAKEYLHCVDFVSDLYATGTDRCAKLWRRADELGLVHLDMITELCRGYKVLRFNEGGDRLYGGLYTDVGRQALRELDVTSGVERTLNSNTISIYDLKLKDENVIFTANFDTTFRMHDRRSNRDESIWEDPFDSSFYCLEYDGLYAVLCGAKYYSRVNLYDIRMPGKYVQLYFPDLSRRRYQNSSPVYSLGCDSRYLFIATDHNLRVFDFKTDFATTRDYFTCVQRI